MAHNIASVRSEEEKQIEAFKQIVALRAHIDTLQRELIDLKRRAIQNVRSEMNSKANKSIKSEKKKMENIEGTAELLEIAREKFLEFDKNKSGFLDGDEMLLLAEWVWSIFYSEGKKVDRVNQTLASNDLKGKFDKNKDGVLDFEEFAEWFLNTVNNLKRLNKAEEDGVGGELEMEDLRQQMRRVSFLSQNQRQLSSRSPFRQVSSGGAGLADKLNYRLNSQSNPRSVSPNGDYPDNEMPGEIVMTPRSLSQRAALAQHRMSIGWNNAADYNPHRKNTYDDLMHVVSEPRSNSRLFTPSKEGFDPRDTDAWKCLMKFSKPARNCIQLFLRLDRNQQNYLGPEEIHSLLASANVNEDLRDEVTQKFFKKFRGENNMITLEQFADSLAPEANEKDIYIVILSILEEIEHNFVE